MKRLVIGVVVGILAGAGGVAVADNANDYTPTQGALAAASDYLAPLVRPDRKPVHVEVLRCRNHGRWKACRVHVNGATHCNGVLLVRVHDIDYAAWMPRMRCR